MAGTGFSWNPDKTSWERPLGALCPRPRAGHLPGLSLQANLGQLFGGRELLRPTGPCDILSLGGTPGGVKDDLRLRASGVSLQFRAFLLFSSLVRAPCSPAFQKPECQFCSSEEVTSTKEGFVQCEHPLPPFSTEGVNLHLPLGLQARQSWAGQSREPSIRATGGGEPLAGKLPELSCFVPPSRERLLWATGEMRWPPFASAPQQWPSSLAPGVVQQAASGAGRRFLFPPPRQLLGRPNLPPWPEPPPRVQPLPALARGGGERGQVA